MRHAFTPVRSDAWGLVAGLVAGGLTAAASVVGLGALPAVVPVALVVAAVVAMTLRLQATVRAAARRTDRDAGEVRALVGEGAGSLRARLAEVESAAAFSAVDLPFPLPLGGWSLKYDAAAVLAREVAMQAPEVCVELGSGSSTALVALQLRRLGRGHVYSLDHEPRFAARTRRMLAALDLDDWATVIDAPLVPVRLGAETYTWYEVPEVVRALPCIDLLVVDGPPLSVDREGMPRYPALPVFGPTLGPGSLVVLDDAGRDAEGRALRRWAEEWPAFRQELLKTQVGLALLRRDPD